MKKNYCILFFNLLIYSLASSQCTPTLFKDNFFLLHKMEINNRLLLFESNGVWTSDGSPEGTTLIYPAAPGVFADVYTKPVEFNNSIYYPSKYYPSDPNQSPYAILCKTDGTDIGSVIVNSFPNSDAIKELTVVGNKLFFVVEFTDFGKEKLWVTNGEPNAAIQVIDLDPSNSINRIPRSLNTINNKLLFWAGNNINYRTQLYITDGTEPGTSILFDLNATEYGYASRTEVLNNKLYYYNGTENSNTGLWVTDGTPTGTALLKNCSYVDNITTIENKIYFNAAGEGFGQEPWVSDGSQAGTYMIKDIYPGSSWSTTGVNKYFRYNNKIYFGSNDGVNGTEVWSTDNTESGTTLLKDIYPGANGCLINSFSNCIEFNSKMYFSAKDELHGWEMWQTDGTAAGTTLFYDFYPGTEDGYPAPRFTFNGNFYFSTYGNFEKKLWYCGGASSSIQEEMDQKLGLFPNPTKGIIQLNSEKELNGSITVYNASGVKVKTFSGNKLEKANLDFSSFPKGLYCMQVNTETIEKQIKFILE
jgi:ELWxxDGT repeat protein